MLGVAIGTSGAQRSGAAWGCREGSRAWRFTLDTRGQSVWGARFYGTLVRKAG